MQGKEKKRRSEAALFESLGQGEEKRQRHLRNNRSARMEAMIETERRASGDDEDECEASVGGSSGTALLTTQH
jgi:hypothetical protein